MINSLKFVCEHKCVEHGSFVICVTPDVICNVFLQLYSTLRVRIRVRGCLLDDQQGVCGLM